MQLSPVSHPDLPIDDPRFRNLLGRDKWMKLAPAVRARFGKRVKGGASVAYQGHVSAMKLNFAGHLLVQLARLIGGPLPYDLSGVGKPAVVIVTEDSASNGQFWIRQYGRKSGFPQVVHSSKRFAGPSGLEEYIGFGIGMALNIDVENDALLFKSDHYFLSAFNKRFRLPIALNPGALVVGHEDLGNGQFKFSLSLKHRLLGELISQDAVFRDAKE